MSQYCFKLQISGFDIENDDYEDTLYKAGCNDALVVIIDGAMFLDFDREAPSYGDAVKSAVKDVERAGGKVIKIETAID